MWKIIVYRFIIAAISVTMGTGDSMIGPGAWVVLKISPCPDRDNYPCQMDVNRTKLNRTHDGFNVWIDVTDEINKTSHSIRIEMCKEMDGGCKPYNTLVDESFCNLANKYAQTNLERALEIAGVESTNCPIAPGKYEIFKYVFDYEELPDDGIYGDFTATALLIKQGDDPIEWCCVEVVLKFAKKEDDDDYEEED